MSGRRADRERDRCQRRRAGQSPRGASHVAAPWPRACAAAAGGFETGAAFTTVTVQGAWVTMWPAMRAR